MTMTLDQFYEHYRDLIEESFKVPTLNEHVALLKARENFVRRYIGNFENPEAVQKQLDLIYTEYLEARRI